MVSCFRNKGEISQDKREVTLFLKKNKNKNRITPLFFRMEVGLKEQTFEAFFRTGVADLTLSLPKFWRSGSWSSKNRQETSGLGAEELFTFWRPFQSLLRLSLPTCVFLLVPRNVPTSPNLPPDSFSPLTLHHDVYYKIFQVGLPSLLLSTLSLHPQVLAASHCLVLKTLLSFVYV